MWIICRMMGQWLSLLNKKQITHFDFFVHMQTWPVRSPRPVATKLAADTPLLTGQVAFIFILKKRMTTLTFMCFFSLIITFMSAPLFFCIVNSVFWMLYSRRCLVVPVPFLVRLVVGKQSLVKPFPR